MRPHRGRTELVKFEPDAMRAFVKYKLLKKVISQCIDRRRVKPTGETKDVESPVDEDEEANAIAMETCILSSKMMFSFVEDLIEDVITVNQYYNSKLTSIQEEFTQLNTIVYGDIYRVATCLRCYK